jgi:hypothetical protein
MNAYFLNDSTILILGNLYVYAIPESSDDGAPVRVSEASIMIYNIRKSIFTNAIPLEIVGDIWPQAGTLAYDPTSSTIIVSMLSAREMQRGHYDSAWSLASYGLNGKFKKWIAREPSEIVDYALGISHIGALSPKVTVRDDGDVLYGYELLSNIYDCQSGSKIVMELSHDNTKYLESYRQLINKQGSVSSFQIDSLFQWKPFWLETLTTNHHNEIVATSILCVSEHPFHTDQLIQWYEPNGELQAESKLPYDKNRGNIVLSQYMPLENHIVVINADKNGWYLSRYSAIEASNVK